MSTTGFSFHTKFYTMVVTFKWRYIFLAKFIQNLIVHQQKSCLYENWMKSSEFKEKTSLYSYKGLQIMWHCGRRKMEATGYIGLKGT